MLRTSIKLTVVVCFLIGLLVACDNVEESLEVNLNLAVNEVQQEELKEEVMEEEKDEMKLQKSTSDVNYYSYDLNIDLLMLYADTLEQKLEYFKEKYRIDSMRTFNVKVYRNFLEMKPHTSYKDDIVISGILEDNVISIQALNPEFPEDIIIHEFTHFVLDELKTPIPLWLQEGISCYEGAQLLDEGKKKFRYDSKIQSYLASGSPTPTLRQLDEDDYAEFLALKGYEFSYSLVVFIVKTYGEDALVDIAHQGIDWQEVLGVDESTLEEQWHSFIEETY